MSNEVSLSPDRTIVSIEEYEEDADQGDESQRLLLSERQQENQSSTPSMSRSFSTESVVSTQSSPPPYELYAPARTMVGRIYNYLRKIPRFATHQSIYLPTLPIGRRHQHHHRIPSYNHHYQNQQQQQRQHPNSSQEGSQPTSADSLSSTSIDSFASSAYPTTWCTPLYYRICGLFPSYPRYVLPQPIAGYRGLLVFLSIMALQLCCFLLFCSVYFAPADLPSPVFPDMLLAENATARLLTLNIFMRPPGIRNNWSDYKDDRLDYIVQHILPHYDVIAFQESFAFATRRKDELIKQARLRYGFNHHIESPRKYPWDISVDGGLLILSKFRIAQSDIIQYPRGTHSDWLSRKGALHALIELNSSRRFHMYTTHTQASYDLENVINAGDTFIRLEQFAQLHEMISSTAGHDSIPIMVIGDLNVDAAVHGPGIPLTRHSVDSSKQYTMMTAVLKGLGVDRDVMGLSHTGDDNDDDNDNGNDGANSDSNKGKLFAHPWVLNDLTDIVYQQYGYHPVTFGDIDIITDDSKTERVIAGEMVLTNHDQLMTVQSIDRIYWSARDTNSVFLEQPHVEPFKVKYNQDLSDQQREEIPFTQISDHYGISCNIRIH